jgi:O-antigen/teichoic acid export membrane protein
MSQSLIGQVLQNFRTQKLSQDIAYTLGSFVVLAISGIVINVLITGLRDAAALGVFNLSYAVYIVASQFAVWGLHYSVLRHAAFYEADSVERGHMLMTAAFCAFGMGLVSCGVVVLAEPLFVRAFNSEATGAAIRNSALGLALFPLNKVLIAYLNGLRRMKAFAVLQAVRYIVVMVLVATVAASPLPIETSAFCFFLAEVFTLLLSCAYIVRQKLAGELRFSGAWVKRHYTFGTKALPAGMFAEVNSRVDVLMIGFFMSDRATGIYSFAAMLVDGLYHTLAMVRVNFSPILVGAVRDKDWKTAQYLRRQSRRLVLPVTIALAIAVVVTFYAFATWIMPPSKGLLEGLPSLIILLTGLVLVCFLVPFDQLMMMSGHPGYQTAQHLALLVTNIGVAALLLPLFGMEGAAAGTAASYLAGVFVLVYVARRVLGWNLVSNTVAPVR